MGNYILKRLVSLCITVAGIAIVTFFLSLIVPLDPLAAIAGPQADPETVERLRALYGFDQPLHVQFYRYIERLAHFDLGMSFQTGRPVLDDILYFFPATFELASIAMIIAIVFGIPLSVGSYLKNREKLFKTQLIRKYLFWQWEKIRGKIVGDPIIFLI